MKSVFQKITAALVLTAMLLSCMVCLCVPAMADGATAPAIVKDGLFAWYDASNNSNGEQKTDTNVWRDLSGNGNHMAVYLNDTNYWTTKSFHVDAHANYFPDEVVQIVNGNEYTIEFVTGELTYAATAWITFMCSDNDEFSLFVRKENGVLEYKYNDNNRDRPEIANGEQISKNATISITFKMTSETEGVCCVYINGEKKEDAVPITANIADSLMWGHERAERAWTGDVYGFRFYNRVLTDAELSANAQADNAKYRGTTVYAPQVEYTNPDEIIGGTDGTTTYVANIMPITAKLNLISPEGWYGLESIETDMYPAEGAEEQWEGAKLTVVPELGNEYPSCYIDYQKYARKTGLQFLSAEDVNYVVLKVKADEGVADLMLSGCAGAVQRGGGGSLEVSATEELEAEGEIEYLVYDLMAEAEATGVVWTGLINRFMVTLAAYEGATVYLYEMGLFETQEEVDAYLASEAETEPVTEPATEENTADAETGVETGATVETSQSETEDPKADDAKGCASVIGAASVVLAAACAAVVLKKKD